MGVKPKGKRVDARGKKIKKKKKAEVPKKPRPPKNKLKYSKEVGFQLASTLTDLFKLIVELGPRTTEGQETPFSSIRLFQTCTSNLL